MYIDLPKEAPVAPEDEERKQNSDKTSDVILPSTYSDHRLFSVPIPD